MFRKKLILIAVIALISYCSGIHYAQSGNVYEPRLIMLNLTENPETEMAITWNTQERHGAPVIQYALSTSWTEFKSNSTQVEASVSTLENYLSELGYHYSAVLSDLTPGQKYIYRVGSDLGWSEWNQFDTPDTTPYDFSFVWFGDPQNNNREHVSRVFREAFKTAPHAGFWLFSGDLISDPEDWQHKEFFDAAGFLFRMVPSIMSPGNHDREYVYENGKVKYDDNDRIIWSDNVSSLWKALLTLPENGIPELAETSYYIDYKGTRFVMLNTNTQVEEQAKWLDALLTDNPNKWTIVSFHYPIYSSGRDRDQIATRQALMPIFDKHDVDLVLTGHDHTYSRSHKIYNNQVVEAGEKGTVYVLSTSGPKQYNVSSNYMDLMAKIDGNVQLFQVIDITRDQIKFVSITADGKLFDEFTLTK